MGRHKRHKPRRPRGESDRPATEWFGAAYHSTEECSTWTLASPATAS
jgi:hypothetical protein